MKKINTLLQRYRVYIVLALLLLLGGFWLYKSLVHATDAIEFFNFMTFVAEEYMPAERRATKKWPVGLTSLRHYATTEKKYSDSLSLIDYMLETYDREFVKMEILLACSNSIVYRIHGKNFTATCKSTVNPDAGYCYFDAD